jgi:hypothetical protein
VGSLSGRFGAPQLGLRLKRRTVDLLAQDRELMTQHEDLDFLGGVTADPQQHHTESVPRQAVQQRPHHGDSACPTFARSRQETSRDLTTGPERLGEGLDHADGILITGR